MVVVYIGTIKSDDVSKLCEPGSMPSLNAQSLEDFHTIIRVGSCVINTVNAHYLFLG